MEEKPLEKIKVSALCKRTGISRTTFYEHFRDVFDVPTWLWDELMSRSLYQMGISTDWEHGHCDKFHGLLEFERFFALAFRSPNYNSVFEHGSRAVKRNIIKNASRNAGRLFTDYELMEIEFHNAGAAYMTREWVCNGAQESPEEMTRLFLEFTPPFLIEYLKVPEDRGDKSTER